MQPRDYFPLGVAVGSAFCNRTEETRLLVQNIKQGKHTLLIATRRYGKSSLALHALKLSGLPYVEIDFYMAMSEKIIENYLLNGVIELIGKALGPVDKLITSIKRYVKILKPKLDIGTANFKLELTTDIEVDPATSVKEGLLLLERLLEEKQKRAVLLLDEFQNVGVIAKGAGIEAAIRHVAQKTKYLTIIFSGSNRKLLKNMFEDESRPLYKLCWKLAPARIAVEHYKKHLQKAAHANWRKELDETAFNTIMEVTERHPYYLNKLCDRLWVFCDKKPPSIKEVHESWHRILEEERSDAVKEISLLSLGQKKVLLQLAKDSSAPLMGKQAMLDVQLTSSSILAALEGLEEKDIVEKNDSGQYQIISPVVKYYVLKSGVNTN